MPFQKFQCLWQKLREKQVVVGLTLEYIVNTSIYQTCNNQSYFCHSLWTAIHSFTSSPSGSCTACFKFPLPSVREAYFSSSCWWEPSGGFFNCFTVLVLRLYDTTASFVNLIETKPLLTHIFRKKLMLYANTTTRCDQHNLVGLFVVQIWQAECCWDTTPLRILRYETPPTFRYGGSGRGSGRVRSLCEENYRLRLLMR